MRHGNLLQVLKRLENTKHKLTEANIASIVYQICLAINYLHASGVIHRDLKLENIMVDLVDLEGDVEKEDYIEHQLVCKLTDFGFATVIDNKKKTLSVGSPIYMAPDVLNRQYDSKCDLWALGVLTYMLLTGKPPFEGKDNDEKDLFVKIRYYEPEYECLEETCLKEGKYAIDFLKKCMNKNPNARSNAHDLLKHKWFKKMVAVEEVAQDDLIDAAINIHYF